MTDQETFPEVMVTAHRKLPRDAGEWLPLALDQVLQRLACDFGMQRATTGMAVGGDTVWGKVVADCGLQLRAAIPYPDQPLDGTDGRFGQRWTKQQIADWQQLKDYAERTGGVEYVHDHNPRSSQERVGMLHARNDWMLKRTQAVVGIWAPANIRGGTYSCLRKAAGAGKPIILVNLATRTVTRPLAQHWAKYLNMPALARR